MKKLLVLLVTVFMLMSCEENSTEAIDDGGVVIELTTAEKMIGEWINYKVTLLDSDRVFVEEIDRGDCPMNYIYSELVVDVKNVCYPNRDKFLDYTVEEDIFYLSESGDEYRVSFLLDKMILTGITPAFENNREDRFMIIELNRVI